MLDLNKLEPSDGKFPNHLEQMFFNENMKTEPRILVFFSCKKGIHQTPDLTDTMRSDSYLIEFFESFE